MKQAFKVSAVLVVALLLIGLGIWAQTTGGTIQGRVTDSKGEPVIGAIVHVSGPAVQGFLGTATDANGKYTIPFVPVGRDYQVKVSSEGFNTVVRKGIEVPLGTTVVLPFQLSSGGTEVVVTSQAPVINLKSTTSGADLSDRMIQGIPLARNSSAIAYLAPSAVTAGPSTPNDPSIGGSTGAENNYIVNGVDVTNTAYGTNNATLNFDFIQSMQVLTGGLPPEYGFSTGGVVNAITQSGGNEFHGGLYFYYFSNNLQAKSKTYSYVPASAFGNAGFKQYDLGASLGGYFIKNKLWFFAAVDWNKYTEDTSVPVTSGDPYLYLNGQPGRGIYAGTSFQDTSTTHWMYATKLSWNINPNHKLALTVFGDPIKTDTYGNIDTLSPYTAPYATKQSPYNVSLDWNATWSPKFFSDILIGYHHRSASLTPTSVANSNWAESYYFSNGVYGGFEAIPRDQTVAPAAINGLTTDLGSNYMASNGFGGEQHVTKDNSTQLSMKFTNELGRHELSYGGQYLNRDYTYNEGLSGPTNWVDPFYGLTAVGSGFVQWMPNALSGYPTGPNGQQYTYFAQYYFTPKARPTNDKDLALWINDNWSITDYFTLKLGLRYEQQKLKSDLPPLTYTVNGLDTVDNGTYTQTLRGLSLTNNYAPRIGFTWDVMHNGKSKLYGFAGRYFDRVPTDMALRSLAGEITSFDAFYDPQLTQPVPGGQYPIGLKPEEAQGVTPGLPVTSQLRSPYTDEYILGYEYQVAPNLKMGLKAVYRALGRTIEDLSVDGANTYIITNPDQWTNVPVPSLTHPGTYVYFPKPTRVYKALEFTMEKRFSNNWQMGGSWVHSSLRGNYEGASSNDTTVGQLDPYLNATYDLPDLLVNGFGYLPLDRTDVVKAYGDYKVPDIPLELSTNFQLETGTPVSRGINVGWYGGAMGFAQPRGSAGRTPTIWNLDLGAQYNFRLWKSNLGLRVDIFNVTNNQKATEVYQDAYNWSQASHPIVALPESSSHWGQAYAHQAPRSVRFAMRWTF